MSTMTSIGGALSKVAIAGGFAGLGVLGLALMGMAVGLPAALVERIVVFVLGALGFAIGAAYFRVILGAGWPA